MPQSAIFLWDVQTGRQQRRLPGHLFGIFSLAFSPDGKQLISGSNGDILHVWDLTRGEDLLSFPAHESYLKTIVFSPDGRLVATGGLEGTLRVWERVTGKPVRAFHYRPRVSVNHVAFVRQGRNLISTGADEFLRFWDVETGRESQRLQIAPHNFGVTSTCSPDGNTLAICPDGSDIRLLDAATGKERQRWEGKTSDNGFFCFSRDGKQFAALRLTRSAPGCCVELLDTATGKSLRKWQPQNQGPITFSADGQTLFLGEIDFNRPIGEREITVHAFDTSTGEDHPFVLDHQLAWLFCLVLSPDGRMLAWGDTEGTVTLWDIAARQVRRRLKGHLAHVTSLAFSVDGKTLASGGADTMVLLWDIPGALDTGPRAAQRLQSAWQDLASKDAARAFDTIGLLTANPEQAVPLLREHLRPVPDTADAKQVARLIAELDSDQFTAREKAMTELRQLGERAEPGLCEALKDKLTLEARKRIDDLLEGIRNAAVSPERLRKLRGVEVLEYIGTPTARQSLEELAKGAPEARLTREAKESLRRFDSRHSSGR